MTEAVPAPIGVIAHYNLLERLEASGPGDLFRARDTKLGRTVAVRLLPADFSGDRQRLIAAARGLSALSHPKVTALCDADANVLEVAADQISDLSGDQPKTYRDFRELLEKDKPEIVIIASPDHWHALQTIAAVKAGAHVFVEKPTGHTVNESRAMLAAAKASGRVVQVGLHRRIGPHHVSGMKFLKSGAVGNVGMVRLFGERRRRIEVTDAGDDDGVCARELAGDCRCPDVRTDRAERFPHRREVAGAVVDERDHSRPFVLGNIFARRLSFEHAARSARANALKQASIL